MALSPNIIAALQIMYTGKGVSASDLNWWATAGKDITYEEAVALFANSADAKAKYPFFQAPQTADKRQYIAQVFANLYNIDINDTSLVPTEELNYWINWLSLSPDNYLVFPSALNHASAAAGLTDRLDALINKTDTSLLFAETFSSVGVNTFTPEQSADASAVIAGVDETPGSVLAAEAQIIELAAGVNVFTVTEALDQVILPPFYTIADSADNLIAASAASVVVDATIVVADQSPAAPLTVANAEILLATADSLAPGVTWDILDSATDVLNGGIAVSGAASVGITDTFVDVATAEQLVDLSNFDGIYAIEDTSAAILANTGIAAGATSVTLTDPEVAVTVADAETLQGLGNFVGPYNIEDTSAAILAAATTGAVLDADSVTLSDPGVPVTVDGAETLQGLGNFVGPYNIEDTSAAILAAATTGAVLDADSVTLSDPGVGITVADAEVLQGLGNFVGPYHILDSSANILAAAGSAAVIDATSVSLSDPGVGVTVAEAETLADIPGFSGPYSIADSLEALTAAIGNPVVDGATAYSLTNSAGSLGIISDAQLLIVQGALNASDFTFTTVDITASRPQVNEGSVTEILVTLSEAQATDTTITFFLTPGDPTAPNTGTNDSNTNDFIGGQFNPITVIIPAGELSASVDYSPFLDGIAELTEGFSVVVTISGSAAGAVFDLGDLAILDGPGDGSIVNLTVGNDIVSATTFIAAPELSIGGLTANTLNTGDKLTGIGDDTSLTVTWVASTFGSNLVQLQMKGVEDLNVTLLQDDLNIFANNPGGVTVTDVKNLKASGSVNGDFSLVDLQSTLETITVQNYFFGDDVNVTIGDPFLAGDDDVLELLLDQVTANKGGNTRVNVSDFSGIGGYETLGITSGVSTTSKGITNTVEIDGILAVESIGITGNENLTLATSLISSVVKVDATGSSLIPEFQGNPLFTGDLKAFVDTPGGDLTFLSGSGNDEISISRTANTAGHILDGGAGNDILTITSDAFSAFDAGHTVIGGTGNDNILLTGDATGPIAGHVVNGVDLGGGEFAEVGGDGDDIIIIEGDAIGSSAGHVVFGGKGQDFIDITGNAIAINSEAGHFVDAGDDDDIVLISGNATATTNLLLDNALAGHTVNGGKGNDLIIIEGEAFAEASDGTAIAGHSVLGGDGNDVILITETANATAIGTAPGTGSGHSVFGGDGNDTIEIHGDALGNGFLGHFVSGGDGNDNILLSGDGNHFATGGNGDDKIVMTGVGSVTFFGDDGEDTLVGAAGNDFLSGDGDDDFLIGGDGDDTLTGGEGDDTMFGDEGADLFIVDAGIDFIGDLGNSTSPDDDRFQVSVNAIANIAVVGDFVAQGGINGTWNKGTANLEIASPLGLLVDLSAANTIPIPPPTNGFTVVGNVGDDTIIGSLDDDTLSGGIGEDDIDGGFGDDIIDGGADSDDLAGDLRFFGLAFTEIDFAFAGGNDTIDGGTGSDDIGGDLFVEADTISFAFSALTGGDDSIDGGEGSDEIGGDVYIEVDDKGGFTFADSTLIGGDDTIDGGTGSDDIGGDLFIDANDFFTKFINSTLIGGDDVITNGTGDDNVGGDVYIEDGGVITFTLSTLIGGNDTIDNIDGGDEIAGDLFIESGDTLTITTGTFIGGNDVILTGALATGFQNIAGDAWVEDLTDLTINGFKFGSFNPSTGEVEVGNDLIAGGDFGNDLFGDLFFESVNAPILTNLTLIGGNDTITGGDGTDLLVGDFAFLIDDGNDFGDANLVSLSDATQFALAGGKDFLEGGKGDDTYYGGGGIDTIVLGNNITNPFGEGLNGNNEIWYMNGASENGARNGANVDVITGFNTINDKFVIAAGDGNFLANLNLQAGIPTIAFGGSVVPPVPVGLYPVNGTVFTLAATVTNATADNLNNVFESVTNTVASFSGGIPLFSPLFPFPGVGLLASNLQMQQINVTSGALAGRQFLFINDGVAEVNTQDDFLVEITGITGTFGGAIPLTENFEVRAFNV